MLKNQSHALQGRSGHQNYEKIEKITTSDRSVAPWRDLQFRFRAGAKVP